jgi:hypothetical protein
MGFIISTSSFTTEADKTVHFILMNIYDSYFKMYKISAVPIKVANFKN